MPKEVDKDEISNSTLTSSEKEQALDQWRQKVMFNTYMAYYQATKYKSITNEETFT